MTLSAGSRLGAYEITGLLGKGGMGEVYQARDSRLGREVAIKVLPDPFASDPDRLARFEREARLLAALNHPNIATIYSLEMESGIRFLSLELVAGETLAERLAAGPLGIEEALAVARQIAEALEAAHEKGIIHRDLKPANVKVTPEGNVKVLDFGLARALAAEAAAQDLSSLPTMTSAGRHTGVILGTAAYMSPEQARGKPLDRRTDIWSFGCVLFELLTGRKAFEGETVSDTLAAILRSEPDWNALPDRAPANIRVLLRRCLQKEPNRRLRDIGDARIEIEEALEGLEKPSVATSPILVAARPRIRFLMPLSPETSLALEKRTAVALSPDGTNLIYVARREGTTHLHLRAMDRLEVVSMAGTEDASGPFFSPDGQWVGFFAGGRLKKISIAGGAPMALCEAVESRGAAWGPDDTIAFTPTPASGLFSVSAAGGAPSAVTTLDFASGECTHRWPKILAGGKLLLFTIGTSGTESFDEGLIAVQSLKTGDRRILVKGASDARFVPTGHLVYARGGALLAAAFDPTRLTIAGKSLPILDGVMTEVTGAAHFTFSNVGSLVHIPGGLQQVRHSLLWASRDGSEQPLPLPPRRYGEPRLSPDGQRLALTVGAMTHDVWVSDIARGTLSRVTFEGDNYAPIWTPDGKRITFSSNREGPSNVFWKASDGSGAEERLLASEYEKVPGSWSPDGRVLAFTEHHPRTGADIWILPLDGDRRPQPFLRTPFNEYAPMFSPNGRWLAYTSDESGRDEVYVMAFPGPGGKCQISADGGGEPLWAREGKELFYRNGNRMMSVAVVTEPTFAAAAPRLLFERPYGKKLGLGLAGLPDYDVAPGDRFVMVSEIEERSAPTQLSVTLEWFGDLTRLVPHAR